MRARSRASGALLDYDLLPMKRLELGLFQHRGTRRLIGWTCGSGGGGGARGGSSRVRFCEGLSEDFSRRVIQNL